MAGASLKLIMEAAYGAVKVLKAVSLAVRPGEFVALLGSSGCGKTTLLRAISGFVPVTGGRILVDGKDISGLPPDKRDMAMVFQSYALWPHMTAAGNIGYGLKLRGWDKPRITERVGQMLAMLKLDGLGDRMVTQLSGGQRQRVALGRALAVDPRILLLDEPLSNLDARIREDVRHEIKALQNKLGITAIHVTHDREEAMVMADRIVILDAGEIAQVARMEESTTVRLGLRRLVHGAGNILRLSAHRRRGDPARCRHPLERDPRAGRCCLGAPGAPGDRALPRRGGDHRRTRCRRCGHARPQGPHRLERHHPGGHWRYGYAVGGQHFMVDDPRRLSVGDAVGIGLPLSSLHRFAGSAQPGDARLDAAPVRWHGCRPRPGFRASGASAQKVTLNVTTAGDQNMVDYVKDYLGPIFEKQMPNVAISSVGTGPGDAGSQKIAEKIIAQKDRATWDVDVAVIHQKMAGDLVQAGLLAPYTKDVASGKMVTSENSKLALGAKVEGYVIPMFNSQTAIAYNPVLVKNPPKTYADIEAWSKANPKQFGYNGIKGGMSGVSFVVGWVYANASNADQIAMDPMMPRSRTRDASLAKLKEFNKTATITPGNAGTLDMLKRGEIAMGAGLGRHVFYTWMAEGSCRRRPSWR